MRTRGRRSAAELAVVISPDFGHRPDPPPDLTTREADIWREVVASEDPNFFNTGALRGLLVDYCRHRYSAEKITEFINSVEPALWLRNAEATKRYRTLLRMRDVEVRGAASLATRLRITNQARYMPNVAARAARNVATVKPPWEV